MNPEYMKPQLRKPMFALTRLRSWTALDEARRLRAVQTPGELATSLVANLEERHSETA